jgi:hypothetical protein
MIFFTGRDLAYQPRFHANPWMKVIQALGIM